MVSAALVASLVRMKVTPRHNSLRELSIQTQLFEINCFARLRGGMNIFEL